LQCSEEYQALIYEKGKTEEQQSDEEFLMGERVLASCLILSGYHFLNTECIFE